MPNASPRANNADTAMRMEREPEATGPLITGLAPGGFRIGTTVLPALTMTTERADPWSPPPLAALALADLRLLVEQKPEFILLGTGPTLARPAAVLIRDLDAQGIGLEIMDSRAAARAWGVLRSEGRIIAAAFYPLA